MKNPTKQKILTNKPPLKAVKYGLFVLLLICQQFVFAYNIRLEINNCPDYYIYLGKHLGPDFIVVDSVVADNGIIEFRKDAILETGVYFIIIPPQTRFDFLIAKEQDIIIKTDTRNILGKLEITGEKQYQVFIEIQREIANINKQRAQLEMELEFFKLYQKDTVKSVQNKIDSLNSIQMHIYSYHKNSIEPNCLLYKIINIMEPFEVPDSIEQLRVSSPSEHYKYYIDHYLDRVDFSDESLLNTPEFIFHRVLSEYCYYFFDMRANKPIEVYPDIDQLVSKTAESKKYNQYVLSYLISRYENPKDLRLEAYLVHVYRAYFMAERPEWVTQQAFDIMKFRIENIQHNVVGLIGKNLNLSDENNNPIITHNVNSKYKILIFWEPECDLCTDAILQLKMEYNELEPSNIQVIAICTNLDETNQWKEFIAEHELRWINAIDLKGDTNLEVYYGTFKTPRLYVLDSNNQILTKDIKPEHLSDFIAAYEKKLQAKQSNLNSMFGQ